MLCARGLGIEQTDRVFLMLESSQNMSTRQQSQSKDERARPFLAWADCEAQVSINAPHLPSCVELVELPIFVAMTSSSGLAGPGGN